VIVNPFDVAFQSVVWFECYDGFNLVGNATRECSVNETAVMYWTDINPFCQIKGFNHSYDDDDDAKQTK